MPLQKTFGILWKHHKTPRHCLSGKLKQSFALQLPFSFLAQPAQQMRHSCFFTFSFWIKTLVILVLASHSNLQASTQAASKTTAPNQTATDSITTPFQIRETYQHFTEARNTTPQGFNNNAQLDNDTSTQPGIVGFELMITSQHYPMVIQVFPNTPADRSGLQTGDQLVAINNIPTRGRNRATIDAMISDIPGEWVHFLILRGTQMQRTKLQVEALNRLPQNTRQELSP